LSGEVYLQKSAMSKIRLLPLLGMLGTGCLAAPALFAQGTPPSVLFDKAYSAEQDITTRDGGTISDKIYCDNGRIRTEITASGMNVVAVVLPDQQKVYSIMPTQKMVMVMPYDPAKYKKYMVGTSNFDGKFEAAGTDTVNGIACDKYKVTTEGKIYDLWVDSAKKQPVKMAAEDGAFTALWKNYQAGPQDPALFQIPADYQQVAMPSMPSMSPGGGGALGQ
jgi:hypothetical protein